MKVFRKIDGKGKLLRKELRELPAELITKDTGDEKKVHEVDPAHIIRALKSDWDDEQEGVNDKAPDVEDLQVAKRKVSDRGQYDVDTIRLRAYGAWIKTQSNRSSKGLEPDMDPKFVFFPEDNLGKRYLLDIKKDWREWDKTKTLPHLKGLDLVVDITDVPQALINRLRLSGMHKAAAKMEEVRVMAHHYLEVLKERKGKRENMPHISLDIGEPKVNGIIQ